MGIEFVILMTIAIILLILIIYKIAAKKTFSEILEAIFEYFF